MSELIERLEQANKELTGAAKHHATIKEAIALVDGYEHGRISTPFTRAIVDQVRADAIQRHLEVVRLNRVVARQSRTIKAMRERLALRAERGAAVVPVEATSEMMDAGVDAAQRAPLDSQDRPGYRVCRAAWDAMVAAARRKP